jgi:hypothetical protein
MTLGDPHDLLSLRLTPAEPWPAAASYPGYAPQAGAAARSLRQDAHLPTLSTIALHQLRNHGFPSQYGEEFPMGETRSRVVRSAARPRKVLTDSWDKACKSGIPALVEWVLPAMPLPGFVPRPCRRYRDALVSTGDLKLNGIAVDVYFPGRALGVGR